MDSGEVDPRILAEQKRLWYALTAITFIYTFATNGYITFGAARKLIPKVAFVFYGPEGERLVSSAIASAGNRDLHFAAGGALSEYVAKRAHLTAGDAP